MRPARDDQQLTKPEFQIWGSEIILVTVLEDDNLWTRDNFEIPRQK